MKIAICFSILIALPLLSVAQVDRTSPRRVVVRPRAGVPPAAGSADRSQYLAGPRWVEVGRSEVGRSSQPAPVRDAGDFSALKKHFDMRLLVDANPEVPSQPLLTLFFMHKSPPTGNNDVDRGNWLNLPLGADRRFPLMSNLAVWRDGKRIWDLDPGFQQRNAGGGANAIVVPGTGYIASAESSYFMKVDDDGEPVVLPESNETSPFGKPGMYTFAVELVNPANVADRVASKKASIYLP